MISSSVRLSKDMLDNMRRSFGIPKGIPEFTIKVGIGGLVEVQYITEQERITKENDNAGQKV